MSRRIEVTDHALVRYLERRWGVDMASLRARIAREVETGVEHGAAAVKRGRLRFVLDGAKVLTVTPRASLPADPAKRR